MKLLAFVLASMITFTSVGSTPTDSINVRFHVGYSRFDPALDNNRQEMENFLTEIRRGMEEDDIERIVVRGYASPDGNEQANNRLARKRCIAIADYIVTHTGVSRNLIEEIPEGVAWGELRRLVAENPDVPSREKILHILDNTPLRVLNAEGKPVDGRKKQLMDLRGGRPYRWMMTNLFPKLRNVVAVTLYYKDKEQPATTIEIEEQNEPEETIVSPVPEINPGRQQESEQIENEIVEQESEVVVEEDIVSVTPQYDFHPHHFALKTNILYDAGMLPNLEFQWLINDNWSVSLEGDVAWWKPEFTKVYRLAVVSPEVRYHIRPRGPMHGWYVGVMTGGGLYQLEFGKKNGHLGEGGMGGVTGGYMWPIGKHFSFDAEIGVGYMYTRYKTYQSRDGHKLYLRTKSMNYFGPLKLKFSIAWRFDITTKTIKTNSTL